MKKVLYYTFGLNSGGVENYSINLYKNIDRNELDVDIVTFYQREEFFDKELAEAGGRKLPLVQPQTYPRWKERFLAMKNLYALAKTGKYDVAYFNLGWPVSILKYPLICRLAGMKKIIIHSHNGGGLNIGLTQKILLHFGRKAAHLIATEKFACSDKAAEWMFGTTKGVHDIKNGIEVERFRYKDSVRRKMREELSIAKDTLVLGAIARFHKQKNHAFMLSMFEKLLRIRPDACLLMVGEGTLRQEMEALAEKLQIADKVLFLGERKDTERLLQAMDVLVMPSLLEGLPIVGIEAQTAGLNCLVADTVSQELDITGNVTFLPLEEEAWVEVLAKHEDYERHDMSQKIRDAGYDSRHTAALVQKIIKKAVGEG
ncbi:glycosyltransferase [Streptococcus marmotae]|uniref:glycosyltransferase n=1 Tax=Streptococcus marmotae TaxID=1825069 RepID=UPI00082D18A1|nr:glycosyltransferase [Streptococcus marmotae]